MITKEQYDTLQECYNFFNKELFDNTLPNCFLTIVRKRTAGGYFWSNKFKDHNKETIHEISLNPDLFKGDNSEYIMSILVHEMVHLWQEEFGNPSNNRAFHNKEWASKMKDVGLIPSNTGEEGGKQTGVKMAHYIEEHGGFQLAYRELIKTVNPLLVIAVPSIEPNKKNNKNTYKCHKCNITVYGKKDLNIICGECNTPMELYTDV